jgi:hypothetical protein
MRPECLTLIAVQAEPFRPTLCIAVLDASIQSSTLAWSQLAVMQANPRAASFNGNEPAAMTFLHLSDSIYCKGLNVELALGTASKRQVSVTQASCVARWQSVGPNSGSTEPECAPNQRRPGGTAASGRSSRFQQTDANLIPAVTADNSVCVDGSEQTACLAPGLHGRVHQGNYVASDAACEHAVQLLRMEQFRWSQKLPQEQAGSDLARDQNVDSQVTCAV